MSTWYRVFGSNETEPEPAALLEYLRILEPGISAKFRGDDQGWFRVELAGSLTGLSLERYLATEEGIRQQLNTWAAWLETVPDNPLAAPLMARLIGTKQVFTVECADHEEHESEVGAMLFALCKFLAQVTDGVYQVDRAGFFDVEGNELVRELE